MSRILLIAPGFFGYCQDIQSEFEDMGHVIDRMSDRPSETVLYKTLSRVCDKAVRPIVDRYFEAVMNRVKTKPYDIILIVGGMTMCFDRRMITTLKKASEAALVAYLWDSLENSSYFKESLDLFDVVFSFDERDCKKYGTLFLPLFYGRQFEHIPLLREDEYDFDACFIGSVHQVNKFSKVKRIVDKLRSEGAIVFAYYYMPSKSSVAWRVLSNPEYRDVEFKFEPLSREDIAALFCMSKVIIDAPQDCQCGLTMRTIETVGAGRKLITTNENVSKYDFFKTGNVMIADSSMASLSDFTKKPLVAYPKNMRQKYSVKEWTKAILEAVGV